MKLTLALLAAAVSASTLRRRGDTWTTDLACFDGSGCQQEDRIGTELITNSSLCQTFSDDCISGMIDITPPKGCQLTFFYDEFCTTEVKIEYPKDVQAHQCFEFGKDKNGVQRDISSVLVRGTCSFL